MPERNEQSFFLWMNFFAQMIFSQADRLKPILSDLNPFLMPERPLLVTGRNKIFDFHLLELPRSKNEILGVISFRKAFPI